MLPLFRYECRPATAATEAAPRRPGRKPKGWTPPAQPDLRLYWVAATSEVAAVERLHNLLGIRAETTGKKEQVAGVWLA